MSETVLQTLIAELQATQAADLVQQEIRRLRGRLREVDPVGQDPDLDTALATIWAHAGATARSLGWRPVLEEGLLGPALREALLRSVEVDDPMSTNAALRVLEGVPLSESEGKRLAHVVRRERDLKLPDRNTAIFLAGHGPEACLATLALVAFRDGPEDADDRLAATAALGRFTDPRAADWTLRLLKTGVASLECLTAVSLAAARLRADAAAFEPWRACLRLAAGQGDDSGLASADATVRWAALDALTRLDGDGALPLLLAAWQAAGDDLPPWYGPYCRQRAAALVPQVRDPSWEHLAERVGRPAIPSLRPLPGVRARVGSRCARVARRAAVEWQQKQGADTEILHLRAALEHALVERGQLAGSLLTRPEGVTVEPGPEWRKASEALTEAERIALVAEERAWVGG
ncbi:MAG: hypothetical protein ACOYOB_14095 [Myxococcota bacterium]